MCGRLDLGPGYTRPFKTSRPHMPPISVASVQWFVLVKYRKHSNLKTVAPKIGVTLGSTKVGELLGLRYLIRLYLARPVRTSPNNPITIRRKSSGLETCGTDGKGPEDVSPHCDKIANDCILNIQPLPNNCFGTRRVPIATARAEDKITGVSGHWGIGSRGSRSLGTPKKT